MEIDFRLIIMVISLALLLLIVWRLGEYEKAQEKKMERNPLVLRYPNTYFVGLAVIAVFFLIVVLFIDRDGLILIIPVFIGLILVAIHGLTTKVIIEDDQIHCKSLFKNRRFTFKDITYAQTRRGTLREDHYVKRLILYSEKGKLFSVSQEKRGFRIFAQRLIRHRIKIVDPDGREVKSVRAMGLD